MEIGKQVRGRSMKRKIAAFANGWSDEYLMVALEGIKRCATESDCDVYLFLEYSTSNLKDENVQGEINILNLPRLEDYDGILLFGNTLMNAGELDILRDKISKTSVPAVCLEYGTEDIDSICTDNYSGMYELCEHLVTEHGVRDVAYVSGITDNKENQERFRAVRECLEKHGLSVPEDHIIKGEWSYQTVQFSIPDYMKEHSLPDAFICANDVMAIGTITALMTLGYESPRDVLVTGFDNIKSGATLVPAITTVDRRWTERSYDGMKRLIELIDGKDKTGTVSYPSTLLARQSCGCQISEQMKKDQLKEINKVYTGPIERTLFDWHLTGLDEATSGRFTLEEVHEGLKNFFGDGITSYEGDTFCICLDQSFVDSIYDNVEPGCLGYSEQVHVLYAKRDGKHLPYQKIKTSYIFPVFADPTEKGNLYIIAPLHSLASTIGYAVFKNYEKVLDTFFLYSWLRHLKTGLMRCRQNIIMDTINRKLRDVSFVDELSGLLNRKGYERKGIPMLEEIRHARKPALMMVVDINKMKMINDRYGHLQGDLAIRMVAQAIKDTIPENWYGIRYGGDEFVIIGENVFIDDGTILKKNLLSALEHQTSVMMIPFELTISVGAVAIDPSEDISLDEYFRRADVAMYEMKKKNHAGREGDA